MTERPTELATENVQSYPRPPVVETVPQRIRIVFGGVTIVDTLRAKRVLETHHPPTYYIPREDVECLLQPVSGRTMCEWKGVARYFDISAGNMIGQRAAWCYDDPTPAFVGIRHYLAFYATKMDSCHVGDLRVDAQAGDFYGGWITANLTGFPKGAPGTEHW